MTIPSYDEYVASLGRDHSFGDVLVARAGTRVTAVSASTSGRVLEDQIEAIAVNSD